MLLMDYYQMKQKPGHLVLLLIVTGFILVADRLVHRTLNLFFHPFAPFLLLADGVGAIAAGILLVRAMSTLMTEPSSGFKARGTPLAGVVVALLYLWIIVLPMVRHLY